METNSKPVVENGMMIIRGVKIELLATPSQTWDLNIRDVVYHITQEQEIRLLRCVLYHNSHPSKYQITKLERSGKNKELPSPAELTRKILESHTYIDDANKRKSCRKLCEIRGYGHMSNWKAFWHCAPYTLAIFFWAWLVMLMGNIAVWIFTIEPGTPFSVSDSVITYFTLFTIFTIAELCFKSGRKYLQAFFSSKILWVLICFWIGFVFIAAINKHKSWADRADDFVSGISPLIALLFCAVGIIIGAFQCYVLLDYAIKEGDNLGSIDQYA